MRRELMPINGSISSERIQDKIAASKRKGLRGGGMAPRGYDAKDRKIAVNEEETETTRLCDMPVEWSRQHQALGLNL